QAIAPLLLGVQRTLAVKDDDVFPMMRVVDGHMPVHQVAFMTVELPGRSGKIRHDKIANAEIFFVRADFSGLANAQTEIREIRFGGLETTRSAALPGEFYRFDTRPARIAILVKMEAGQDHEVDVALVTRQVLTFRA